MAALSSMQDDFPLTLTHVLRRMRTVHAAATVTTLRDEGGRKDRATFAEIADRAGRLAAALRRLGVRPGDRVATFAWNTQEHVEAYYAVTCSGAVLHTANLRLHPEQVAWTMNHAGDRVVIFDDSLVAQMEQIRPHLEHVEHLVMIGDGDPGSLTGVLHYEDVLATESAGFAWPELKERAGAALCYTSGTTGDPKGVLYSHRSIVLHVLAMAGFDVFRVAERDRVLAIVPMFHAMGWNLPFICGIVGADLVMPGRFLQSPFLARLIEEERITYSSGVPTIWMDLLRHVDRHDADLGSLETVVSGGTQVPPVLMETYEERFGVKVVQGWGMTETFPGAAMAHDWSGAADDDERWALRATAGRVSPLYEVRVVGDDGGELPWDGESTGEIEIRGPNVTCAYFRDEQATAAAMDDGWLRTGDVGSIDAGGWIRITDRAKDVIKSGGEWISSVDVESALMRHPAVVEAAVIPRPDERWSERPLACVVVEGDVDPAELRGFLAEQVVRWWLPDDFAFLDEIPKTSVGKFDKKVLRVALAAGDLPVRTVGDPRSP
ncbi:long-chain fatty acid--CoA ligase [Capillimicrobium parvum]|uniref:Long-chain-fatty-acid--CoA ligase n=1 Tax=Capillimicrobium parvum TaxID=2884022 RepID=A0A9E7C0D7_9ACTN|nr:long-chain fatty acid--CoA ligase [Capillimicrobium parvum]UGS35519.1 Long-chain-fatty-acid--CoA ligase [Capillimicrobium parvum]